MKRIHSYSYIRAIACIGIIFIHVLTSGIAKYGALNSTAANIAYWSVVDCIKWCVPCFFMVSGMLLLNPEKEISYKYLFSKYIYRVLMALILFGTVFTVLDFIFSDDHTVRSFLIGWSEVLTGSSWAHLWYLYALIGIYLLLPFYKMIAGQARERDLRYLLIVYVIFLSILSFFSNAGYKSGFYIHVSSIYPFWFFYGYYLKTYGFKKNRAFYAALALIGTALLILLTVMRRGYGLEILDPLFNYSSIVVMLQTTGIVGFLYKSGTKEGTVYDRVLCCIDRHSFGIYLMHMIPIWIAYTRIDWDPFAHGGFFGVILLAAVSFAAAMILDVILKKIPGMKKIL